MTGQGRRGTAELARQLEKVLHDADAPTPDMGRIVSGAKDRAHGIRRRRQVGAATLTAAALVAAPLGIWGVIDRDDPRPEVSQVAAPAPSANREQSPDPTPSAPPSTPPPAPAVMDPASIPTAWDGARSVPDVAMPDEAEIRSIYAERKLGTLGSLYADSDDREFADFAVLHPDTACSLGDGSQSIDPVAMRTVGSDNGVWMTYYSTVMAFRPEAAQAMWENISGQMADGTCMFGDVDDVVPGYTLDPASDLLVGAAPVGANLTAVKRVGAVFVIVSAYSSPDPITGDYTVNAEAAVLAAEATAERVRASGFDTAAAQLP